MIARVLRVDVGAERVDAVVEAYRRIVRPIHAQASGLRAHYVLVDREGGWLEIVGVWDSAEAIQSVSGVLEPARERLWATFDKAPTPDLYEVADELVAGSDQSV